MYLCKDLVADVHGTNLAETDAMSFFRPGGLYNVAPLHEMIEMFWHSEHGGETVVLLK
jgi:hypothetical protein